jgi:hypothetical protein
MGKWPENYMRAFFVSHTPRDYVFWGVLWWVFMGGDNRRWNPGKLGYKADYFVQPLMG